MRPCMFCRPLLLRSVRPQMIVLVLLLFSMYGCKGGSGSGTSGATQQTASAAIQNEIPWAFRFAASSQNSREPLTVDANVVMSSAELRSTEVEIQGACTTPSTASESVTGTMSGSAVSITIAYGGETTLLTGALAADPSSMDGSYSATGACGPESGRCFNWRL
jgi:hypothetical protein